MESRVVTYPGIIPNHYLVYEDGRIYNIKTGNFLKLVEDDKGYFVVPLKHTYGKYKNEYVARIVAWEFCERKEGKNIVNHIDENPHNNHYTNLEWTDYTGNRQHSIKTGSINFHGNNSPTHKYSEEIVRFICEKLQSGMTMKQVYNLFHPGKNVKYDNGLYILIQRIRNKQCWLNIVSGYNFDLEKTKAQRKAESYSSEKILKYIRKGMSNMEIMNKFGFSSIQENPFLYDKIRRLRKKNKGSTTIESPIVINIEL